MKDENNKGDKFEEDYSYLYRLRTYIKNNIF